jgi:nitroimidazol reductase NimA-like FMN-containing flavoprotein (pyridoxamine 5'-phosphate oxidase superfamily)
MVSNHPPGATLRALSVEECWERIQSHSVGRFAANRPRLGPLVVPVNYQVTPEQEIVFRSGAGEKLDVVGRGLAVLEVDEVDPLHHTGWSVMVEGTTTWLYEEQDATAVETWAPGRLPYVVHLTPTHLSGRQIVREQDDEDGRGYR